MKTLIEAFFGDTLSAWENENFMVLIWFSQFLKSENVE